MKKVLSIILAAVLLLSIFSVLPMSVSAASGSGKSLSDPCVVSSFAEFKEAMESTEIEYVKLTSVNETLPDKTEYASAITVKGMIYDGRYHKTLIVEGKSVFWSKVNSSYDNLLYVANGINLNVTGTGSIEFKNSLSNGFNAVIKNDGNCTVEDVTLFGSRNNAVYGYAIVNSGGSLTINSGTYKGVTAFNGNGPFSAVRVDGGETYINGGTFISEIDADREVEDGTNALAVTDDGAVVKVSGGTFTTGIRVYNSDISAILDDYCYLEDQNGNEVSSQQKRYDGWVTIKKHIVSAVSATVTAPRVGQTPTYKALLPLGGGYALMDKNDGGYQNGVLWYNVTDNVAMTASDTFQSGKKYQVRLYLKASDYYSFADDLTGTINNNEASILPSKHTAIVDYTFTMGTFTKSIDKVEVTNVTAPTAGAKPAYTATVPTDSGYMLAGINSGSWSNSVIWFDENNAELSPDATFVQGKQYKARVALSTSSSGYKFRSMQIGGKVRGTINGNSADVIVEDDGDICFVSYTFTCAEAAEAYTLSGTATSYLDDSVGATLMLFRKNTDMDVFVGFTVAASDDGSYQFSNVAAGDYRLTVLKNNHVPRDYAVTVSGDTTQDVKICPLGDVDGNGKVQAADAMKAYQHAQGKADAQLTGYAFQCADVAPVGEPNGKVQAADAMVIYQQAQGKSTLF